jgi:hypothetical protein
MTDTSAVTLTFLFVFLTFISSIQSYIAIGFIESRATVTLCCYAHRSRRYISQSRNTEDRQYNVKRFIDQESLAWSLAAH